MTPVSNVLTGTPTKQQVQQRAGGSWLGDDVIGSIQHEDILLTARVNPMRTWTIKNK